MWISCPTLKVSSKNIRGCISPELPATAALCLVSVLMNRLVARLDVEPVGLEFAWTETLDHGGVTNGVHSSTRRGWLWTRLDAKQPPRLTYVSLKTWDKVWRWFTVALTETMTPGMRRRGRRRWVRYELAEGRESSIMRHNGPGANWLAC